MEKEVKSSSNMRLNSIEGGASALGQSKRTGKFKRSKASVFHLNVENASNWLQRNQSRSTAAPNDSEDLSDIDDAEIAGYLVHNEKEMEFKRTLWEMMNKKYLKLQFLIFSILGLYWQGKQLKGARKVKKRTPSKKAIKIAGQTQNKKRSSSKINYDVLKKLLDDEPEEVPGKVEDSKRSNASYADSQQVDENSIPEGHISGASEENDEHEHDYGETDAGNNDYSNDVYFENEEDDYHYAEDYD
ncbi:PREDICTED: uncharacterized protein LOC105127248 isoform X2 [Populus euphratica]|uniref:Uncharacterized protein LOC105127248 isoform X2 n=1 Tax=Populus euphratica TaxID=75702 RepID=A0AAJ6XQ08_POPEU|nr:PREDICTED: uncharacterized protein LOC105127248 isoform X2 [Populus euphratica]